MDIAVSTLALVGLPAEAIIEKAQKNNWALEFSSGMPYRADMEELFLSAAVKRYAHNYFPAPEIPFVLNLGSANEAIRSRSIEHCFTGLHLSKKANSPFFSAHAGFCVDPHPDELGRKLALSSAFDREKHWRIFIDAVQVICKEAFRLGLNFLIENNVLAKVNIHPNGSNPLLCCDAEEMLRLVKEIDHSNFGLLLDTAHLKVSANTLGFDKDEAVKKIEKHLQCIHHSDNDSTFDTNEKLPADYWFLKHLRLFNNIVHVLEVKKLTEAEISQQLNLLTV